MPVKTQQLVNYLQACFAWEYSNLGGQNLLSKSLRGRHFLTLETIFSGLSKTPQITAKPAQKLVATLEKNTRSSDLWYGIFPIQAQFARGRLQGKYLCAPLFVADLSVSHLTASYVKNQKPPRPMLMVNRLMLTRLLDNDTADQLANALQDLVDAGPLGKTEVQKILTLLSAQVRNLTAVGFELFPLLSSEAQLTPKPQLDHPVLTCAGVVYISKRSRQSMGVLHELGELKRANTFSTPTRHLVDATPSVLKKIGPLNVIGALSTPQRNAIKAARKHSLSVVHGPPGTGKTHVLAMLVADQIANGQSVLVCTRNNAAIDVIEKVICDRLNIEEAVVRGGSAEHLRQLKSRLTLILQQGAISFGKPQAEVALLLNDTQGTRLEALKEALRKLSRQLTKTDSQLNTLARSINDHVQAGEGTPSFLYRFRKLVRSTLGAKLQPLEIARCVTQWQHLHKRREELVVAKLQIRIQLNVAKVLKNQRTELAQLARSVTAREHNQRSLQRSTKYNVITQTLPLWMSSLADLSHILPLQNELFDVLIIDEASQADIASSMPALHRAKRAVIIGDAHQLKHVSFLPNAKERELLNDFSLSVSSSPSFRNDSILDWSNRQINTSAASSFLDEHFRSAPSIISFSNREFYGNQLKLLTTVKYGEGFPSLQLVKIENAVRNKKTGANPVEALSVLERLKELVSKPVYTVGVVSPFRAQVDLLDKLVLKELSASQRDAVDLIVGTAHELQGEERDIILFSSCIDDFSTSGSLTFLSRPDVLNVSVTRARREQVVFLSRNVERLAGTTLFGRYIQHVVDANKNPRSTALRSQQKATNVGELLDELSTATCDVQVDVLVGSVRIDVLLSTKLGYLGIDLIGFGGDQAHHGLHRHELELLYRLNVPIVPVTALDLKASKSRVVEYLNDRIAQITETSV